MCVYVGLRTLGFDGCLRWLPCRSVTVPHRPAVMVFATSHLTQLVVKTETRLTRNPSRLGSTSISRAFPYRTNRRKLIFQTSFFIRFKINVINLFLMYVWQSLRRIEFDVLSIHDGVLCVPNSKRPAFIGRVRIRFFFKSISFLICHWVFFPKNKSSVRIF